jgi:predicted component of type VI protein secretion system
VGNFVEVQPDQNQLGIELEQLWLDDFQLALAHVQVLELRKLLEILLVNLSQASAEHDDRDEILQVLFNAQWKMSQIWRFLNAYGRHIVDRLAGHVLTIDAVDCHG